MTSEIQLDQPLESLSLSSGVAPPGTLEAVAKLATASGLTIASTKRPSIDDLDVGLSDFQDAAIRFGFNDKSKGAKVWRSVVRTEIEAHNLVIEGQPQPENRLEFTEYPEDNGRWTVRDHWEDFGDLSLSSLDRFLQSIREQLDPSDTRVNAMQYQFIKVGPKGIGKATFHFLQSLVELQQRQVK